MCGNSEFPPPQRAVRTYVPGRRVAGIRVDGREAPGRPDLCVHGRHPGEGVGSGKRTRDDGHLVGRRCNRRQRRSRARSHHGGPSRGRTVRATVIADVRWLTSSPLATAAASPQSPRPGRARRAHDVRASARVFHTPPGDARVRGPVDLVAIKLECLVRRRERRAVAVVALRVPDKRFLRPLPQAGADADAVRERTLSLPFETAAPAR